MSIFDIDHLNTVWRLLLPPDKRRPKWLAWGMALLSGKQSKQDTFFKGYMTGAENLPAYNAGPFRFDATTNVGDRIVFRITTSFHSAYGDNAVYEAIKYQRFITHFPTGDYLAPDVPPDSATDNPADALAWVSQYYWIKIQDNFIGANERVMYNASRLIFEYALNRWFFTHFHQPSSDDSVHSDIYIVPNQRLYDYLYMGPAENGYNYIPADYADVTVYVPLSSVVVTSINGANGDVFEYTGEDSAQISCTVKIYGSNLNYPMNDMDNFYLMLESNQPIKINSWYLNQLEIYYALVTDYELPQKAGNISDQQIKFNMKQIDTVKYPTLLNG